MTRIDIGCGFKKPDGFIGMDRYSMKGVDVIGDFNFPLPFGDNVAELVYASHSLEHSLDLIGLMREIYRICKHGAQVCIVAPYGQQSLNLANPYHKQFFNEHTPWFWTSNPYSTVEHEEYIHPQAENWGLSESDLSSPGIDFRCLKISFFYFP